MSDLDVNHNRDESLSEIATIVTNEQATTEEKCTLSHEEKIEKTLKLKEEGNCHFKQGDYESSIKSYLDAVHVCPENDSSTRAILFSNLAAAKDHLDEHEEAIQFCNEALALNDKHAKALIRRAQLYQKSNKLDESLADFEEYLKLIPADFKAEKSKEELKIEIEQRNEKMKTEMLSKLKTLGNVVLKPFGLSTNNFQLVQNPENGSYSVNFQNDSK